MSFNVLDRHLDLRKSYLLEASAGTGKTYSIENIAVRLLIDPKEPLLLENILLVTFTRAATAELKQRVRQAISQAIDFLAHDLPNRPDYIAAIIEAGEVSRHTAKRALEQALFCFDQAQIFTIHGFCARMLRDNGFESDLGFNSPEDTGNVPYNRVLGVIRNYLRTETGSDVYSPEQLRIILAIKGNQEELERKLYQHLTGGVEVVATPNFSEQLASFQNAMRQLREQGYTSSPYIYEDFEKLSVAYNGIKNNKAEVLNQIEQFAALFEQNEWSVDDFDLLMRNGLGLLNYKRSARGKLPSDEELHYPRFYNDLQHLLHPIVELAKNPMANYARMAAGCQQLFKRYCAEEELATSDDLLQTMFNAVQEGSHFAARIRQLYRAVIIDEFQDTDPIQWGIFSALFVSDTTLYLVGDPKQSIYAFRRADIYTYLEAAQLVKSHLTLDTNYRSQLSLVEALNRLFSNTPGLIPLPRLKTALPYKEVRASARTPEKQFSDQLGAVHFSIRYGSAKEKQLEEERYYFPFIAAEIRRLTQQDGLSLRKCAILVRDRHESARLLDYLNRVAIPALAQRNESLADSPALPLMQALLQAALYPWDQSAVKVALGGQLIGWTHQQLRDSSSDLLEEALARFRLMRLKLLKGFTPFFQEFMASSWGMEGKTIAEKLLSQQGGLQIYQDLAQIGELLAEQQSQSQASPDTLLAFLETFPLLQDDEDKRLARRQDPTQDAVQIMTMHVSKGLEFDVVFALGLMKRSSPHEELIRVARGRIPS